MYSEFLVFIIFIKYIYTFDINSNKNETLLSRRKRYIVFPEGSSLQLVYCLTMPTYGMGNIFTIGLTAALAWELPHEPIHLKKGEKTTTGAADKRIDKPTIVDIHPVYKHSRPISDYQNPWSNVSWNTFNSYKSQYDPARNKKQSFNYKTVGNDDWDQLPAYKNDYLYRKHADIHRRTRRDLFGKIEKFFMAQNKDGKACLLKALCEVNQITNDRRKKGTFMEEILRAVFTWKVYGNEDNSDIKEYNDAATSERDCSKLFPSCSHSVWDAFF